MLGAALLADYAQRSGGDVKFKVASLYPLLYRLEDRGWIVGRWVEAAGSAGNM